MFDIVDKHWPMSEGDGKATRKKRPRILAIHYRLLHRMRRLTGMYRILPDRGMHVLGAR
jgi:hypothetical protein